MKLYYPPRTDNPNLNVWLAHLAKELSDPASLFAGLGKMTGATFDWNARQLTNVGGLSIGSPSLPGKGNLLIGDGGHINIEGGGNINLDAGGDIILAPSDSNPALIKWSTLYNMGAALTDARGLCFWPTTINTGYFYIGYDPVNNQNQPFNNIGIKSYSTAHMISTYNADNNALVSTNAGNNVGYIRLWTEQAGADYEIRLRAGTLDPYIGSINIGSSGRKFNDGWFGGKTSSGTATITASSDITDVSGINTLFINPAAAVTIGAFIGGVNGQELRVVIIDNNQNVTLEHSKGTGNQNILLHKGANETIDSHYGGWNLVCDGSSWYDESHAKHV